MKRAGSRMRNRVSEEIHRAEIAGLDQDMVPAGGALDLIRIRMRGKGGPK